MRIKFAFAAVAAMTLLACSDILIAGPQEQVTVAGPLTFTVTDTLGFGGVLFAKPTVTVQPSGIVVTNTRYGSLCIYDVSGQAVVSSSTVSLRVKYVERLTSCTGEIRFLRYRAEIGGLTAKSYTVYVIHEENNHSDTLVTQPVTLP
ncbi:MAG: hypothetical protein ABIY52_12690 [Gemmatimonadaceae bacterium]